ncbi:Uncharacterised protein [Escherichia coli]|uniref:Uncharacterized protein n=1 Tax=Escherichia coli TaxID=562 RepID=A0A3S4MBF4_ECOLX|nr:Uncharacterised protein [Escherichia coli]
MADISTPNLDYNDMLEAWDINDALMGGTLEMRRQGENYLPKWPNEDEDAYKKRLSVATLLPVYEESIKQNIGRIFAEPTVLSEETPEKIREYAENIDMEGSDWMCGRSNFSVSHFSMVWHMRWWTIHGRI